MFVGNVRGFQHDKARVLPISPEQFRDRMNFLPDGAVCFIDEASEHEMLPKRPAGSKVPDHVRELAKHRHRGLDFIFVSQSPAKQVDEFLHDLIERHIHVRRRFGLPFGHLRIFERFERNPEKAHPLILRRVKLPKRPTDRPASNVPTRDSDYVAWLTPRNPGQPWTAPAYDKLNVPMQTPRVFCMASGHDARDSCTCLTEQGTRHVIESRTAAG